MWVNPVPDRIHHPETLTLTEAEVDRISFVENTSLINFEGL